MFSRPGLHRWVREQRKEAVEPILNVGAGGIIGRIIEHGDFKTVDFDPEYGPDIVADVCKLDQHTEAESFATVFMIEVLEHVPDPATAVHQLHRVLQPGGKLYLSVPYAIEIHLAPHDYWRFTPFSLKHLLASFEAVDIVPRGGYVTASLTPLLRLAFQPNLVDKCIGRILLCLAVMAYPALWLLDRIVSSDAYASGFHVVATKSQ
ncbi:Ubiquinone biosynthesis O-methyltransferase [Rubripirellula amarantea]|uniref:Ubiquinone biosynthesis O-methyltransferase n=1 Tax=Rubripirellula amarantea TaxID=2527999 RepID=A0A5C5WQ78_9BACT|nr:methyltransferase domain-containing protein [Rubripirellula amarantea]TWT52687.1 Ubiquinone biosynthesis O-methyltransferase [Rubripirellula amarantea]